MFNRILQVAFMWFQHNIYNDTYTGEITEAQRAGMAKATNASFSGNNFTYYFTEPIGPDTSTQQNIDTGAKLYIVRSHLVDPNNLTEEARRFSEYVRSGNAFTSNTPGTTTTAGTTTTTTAATTTTTTT